MQRFQPDEADPVVRLEIGTEVGGFGVDTLAPTRERDNFTGHRFAVPGGGHCLDGGAGSPWWQ
jgi:hypothetical protein